MKFSSRKNKNGFSALGIIGSIMLFLAVLGGWYWFLTQQSNTNLLGATETFFSSLAGLALFLFGLDLLSSGLKQSTADRLKNFLSKWAKNTPIGVFIGFLVTAILQSSSATTVIVVGFVNASIMSLKQAIAIVMGANIGTTVTGQIISFDLERFSLPLLSIGLFMYLFGQREVSKYVGKIVGGFGLLFFGLDVMKSELGILKEAQWLQDMLVIFSSYPLVGMLAGALFTTLVQSSSAALGITIVLASSGAISFDSALPLILGLNVGTTITANIAALHGSLNAKRVARVHSVFNIIGAVLVFLILPFFKQASIAMTSSTDVARQIANAHTIFNIGSVVIFLPFLGLLQKMSFWLIPKSAKEQELQYLDTNALQTPSVALDQVEQAIREMFGIAQKVHTISRDFLTTFNERKGRQLIEIEGRLDRYHDRILTFLSSISKQRLSEKDSARIPRLIQALALIEQIGDLGEQLHIAGTKMVKRQTPFTAVQKKDIRDAAKRISALFACIAKTFTAHPPKNIFAKIDESYAKWTAYKNKIIAKHKAKARSQSSDLTRINYYLDVILTYNEIAKKCRGIIWEDLHEWQKYSHEH